jgi:hypothetical protein
MSSIFSTQFDGPMGMPTPEQREALNKALGDRPDNPPNALSVQEGGDHYKTLAIQPVEYIHANKISYIEGSIIKYVTRHRSKNGAQDIRKAIHFCQLLLELEYSPEKKRGN